MKTQIFENYSAFLNRTDWEINGVSQEFADQNPNYLTENQTNQGCWCCSKCSHCSDCYNCSKCSYCADCSLCSSCLLCSKCLDCCECSHCSDCLLCFRCSERSDCFRLKSPKESESQIRSIPIVPNIHAQVLEVVSKPDALNMETWHTCNTTHCRAGWVVILAGEEGKKLEEETSTLFAAMQIYKASSPIRTSSKMFFDSNQRAMDDIKKYAELEMKGEARP